MIETIILCSILAIIVFGIQFVLCSKANKKAVKRIPAYIIIALYAIALILCLVDWLDGSGGVAIWVIFAFIISIATQTHSSRIRGSWYLLISFKNGQKIRMEQIDYQGLVMFHKVLKRKLDCEKPNIG